MTTQLLIDKLNSIRLDLFLVKQAVKTSEIRAQYDQSAKPGAIKALELANGDINNAICELERLK